MAFSQNGSWPGFGVLHPSPSPGVVPGREHNGNVPGAAPSAHLDAVCLKAKGFYQQRHAGAQGQGWGMLGQQDGGAEMV